MGNQSPAPLVIGQRNVQPLDHAPPRSFIELLRPVGGPNQQNPVVFVRGAAIKLHQKLRFHTSRRFKVAILALRQETVNFVYEHDRWLVHSCNGKQRANHFLALSDPFGHEGRRRNGEK